MEGSLYLSLGGCSSKKTKEEGGFPSRPAVFYLKASWGQHPTPESQGWPWVPLAGFPSPAAAPGDKPRPLPPENKRDIQPPPAAARARPPGKLGVESAAIAFKSRPPAVRGALGTWLRAPSERDAAVSCRPWGARAPASRSACCWPPRSWPGRRPQRGNARPALPRTPEPAPRHRRLPCSPGRWRCGPRATTWRGSLSLASLPRGLCAGAGFTSARMCSLLFPALFFPALANLRGIRGAALLSESSL